MLLTKASAGNSEQGSRRRSRASSLSGRSGGYSSACTCNRAAVCADEARRTGGPSALRGRWGGAPRGPRRHRRGLHDPGLSVRQLCAVSVPPPSPPHSKLPFPSFQYLLFCLSAVLWKLSLAATQHWLLTGWARGAGCRALQGLGYSVLIFEDKSSIAEPRPLRQVGAYAVVLAFMCVCLGVVSWLRGVQVDAWNDAWNACS